MKIPDNIMFNGGGYSGAIEHFGHVNALIDFTPLCIFNAQSASPSSLITAHGVGVLNEKRCNIISKKTVFYGNSAGTLFALLMLLYVNKRIKKHHIHKIQSLFVDSMRECQIIDTTEFIFTTINNVMRFCYPTMYLDACDKFVVGITTRDGFRAKQFLFAGYLANKNNYTTHLSFWK